MTQDVTPIEAIVSLLGLSVMTATVRSILSDEFTWKSWIRKVILSFFVGGVAGALLHEQSLSPGTQGAIIAMCCFTADSLLLLVLEITQSLQKNPRILIDYFLHRVSSPLPGEDEPESK